MDDSVSQLTAEQYISSRLEQYQGWYDGKAVAMKAKYLRMRAMSVIGGSLVPVLINVPYHAEVGGVSVVQVIVTLISLLVVISLSLESVFHYREQWKNYRSTEQLLGHENFFSEPVSDDTMRSPMKMHSACWWNASKMLLLQKTPLH
ncbi:MAG TPA: DUF4231 domain-containing protein [Terracidiphilus sp.]|jgi:hypothetical protein